MPTDETRTVVERHLAALASGDIERIMADYTDESVFLINLGGTFVGKDAIRPFFEATGSPAGFEETGSWCEDDTYLVTWKADGIPSGNDTLIVRDGKIVRQTVVVVLPS